MKSAIVYRIIEKINKIGKIWDSMAQSEETVVEYAHKHINPEPDRKIAGTQQYTNEYCLAHSGETINDRFRQDRAIDIDYQIAKTVSDNTTDTDLIVYRGVHAQIWEQMKENAKGKPYCDLYEKGFLATSLIKGHETRSQIRLRIFVPAGTKAIYQGNVNEEQYYYEVDIMHGASLKILSIDETYINCLLLRTN